MNPDKAPRDEAFLAETKYCDFSHPAIQKRTAAVVADLEGARERAVALFYFVRDHIMWELANWNRRASETLAQRRGSCSNKANLLVAMLRAAGIRAGFHVMHVAPEYLGDIIPHEFWQARWRRGKPTKHFYSAAFIDTQWLRIDATDDIGVSECAFYVPEAKLVDFDGRSDALLNIKSSYVLCEEGPVPDIDGHLARPPSNSAGLNLAIARVCQQFVRCEGARFRSASEMHEALFQFLACRYPLRYYAFRAILKMNAWLLE